MCLDKSDAIDIEKTMRKNCGPRYTYIFKCKDCSGKIRIRSDALKTATGKCKSCNAKKKPFESIYNGMKSDWRKLKFSLTYDEYIEFTKIESCHYCVTKINWKEYSPTRAYYLDRKNNDLGYEKDNCVVCCTKCNMAKGNRYSYEDWYGMTEYLRNKEE